MSEKQIYEAMNRTVISMEKGGLVVEQIDEMGVDRSIWIPGRYVAQFIESLKNVAAAD